MLKQMHFLLFTSFSLMVWKLAVFSEPLNASSTFAKIAIFQQTKQYEVDSRTCRVGVVFKKPIFISCTCVTGIWALYERKCAPSTKILGGSHFCIKFPIPIQVYSIILYSKPKELKDSATLFQNKWNQIHKKISNHFSNRYYNKIDQIMTFNDSYRIEHKSEEKIQFACLENTAEENFCFYDLLKNGIHNVSSISKTCLLSDRRIQPYHCDFVHESNSENICILPESGFLNPDSKASEGLTAGPIHPTKQEEVKIENRKTYFLDPKKKQVKENNETVALEEYDRVEVEIFEKEWNNIGQFMNPPISNSNSIMLAELRKYQEMVIKESLGTWKKAVLSKPSNLQRILNKTKKVLQKICTIIPKEYFDAALEAFFAVQYRINHFKDPFLDDKDYSDVSSVLEYCQYKADAIYFNDPGSVCHEIYPVSSISKNHNANLKVAKNLNSDGREPVVEIVWKMFAAAHSICSSYFFNVPNNGLHKYVVIIMPMFMNQIQDIWNQRIGSGIQYGGLMGNTTKMLNLLDECLTVAGMKTSATYEMELWRPTKQHFEKILKRRQRRDLFYSNPSMYNSFTSTERKKVFLPLELQSSSQMKRTQKDEASDHKIKNNWKRHQSILDNQGYCIKKYSEPKRYLGENC